MVIGSGDIASVIKDKEHITYFACGVSNSQEQDVFEYEREARRLLSQPKNKRLVYISSLAIYYSDTRYTRHKLFMEELVKTNFPKYCIIRIGNIDWGKNPNTIINYFRNNPDAPIKDGYRYIINKEYFLHWMELIPNFNTEMNLTGTIKTIKQIYDEREIYPTE